MIRMSPNCPICKREVPWYGKGDRPAVPCIQCEYNLPRTDATPAALWKAATEIRSLTVIRRREITPTIMGRDLIHRVGWNLTWRTMRHADEGWQKLSCVERLFMDDYGNISTPLESIWAKANAADFDFHYDRSWTGSF